MGEYDYGAINNNPTYAFNNMLAANAAGATNVANQLTNSFNNQAALANQSMAYLGAIGPAQAPGTYSPGSGLSSFSGTPLGGGGNAFQTGAPAYNDYSIPNFGAGAQPNYGVPDFNPYGGIPSGGNMGVDSQGGIGPSPWAAGGSLDSRFGSFPPSAPWAPDVVPAAPQFQIPPQNQQPAVDWGRYFNELSTPQAQAANNWQGAYAGGGMGSVFDPQTYAPSWAPNQWSQMGVDSQGGIGPSPFGPNNMPIQTQPMDNSWTIDSYGNPVPRGYGNTGMDLYGKGPYAPSQPPPFGGQSPINGVPAAGAIGPYMDPFTSYPWNGNPAAAVDYRFPQFDWETQNYMNQLNQGLNNTMGVDVQGGIPSQNTLSGSDYSPPWQGR